MEKKIADYKTLQLLYESEKTLVYRAVKNENDAPLILKFLKSSHPGTAEILKLIHGYEIRKSLNLSGIINALRLEKYDGNPVLVLQDVGGKSLHDFLKEHTLAPIKFLEIAIVLAGTLGDIHHQQVIHKDIKPGNIIIVPDTLEVYINDFGISTRLSRENPKVINRHILEGTLNYISPEQTGRMNRDIDYRTDIYSLGVTFYEMSSGKLPFQSHDSLELIHMHIAMMPISPHEINPAFPKPISDIIMKCLAKDPESRYHSAYGLKNDLEECLRQLTAHGEIKNFTVGSRDIFNVFQIPQTLYGREREIEKLLEAFSRICVGRSECIMISGYAGIGKTSLINEVQKPIVKQHGYFVTGKFDQLKQEVPYSGLIEALKDLIDQALTESETDLTILKHKLLATLHNSAQILIDLIPELELIIGKQPPAASLGTQENQNRLKLLFKNFIRVFSKKEHPLVIFLDDLQWAGASTLMLVKELITDPTIQHLLVIGTYRDQETGRLDALQLTFDEIRKEKGLLQNFTLEPLSLDDIKRFTADLAHCSKEKAGPLAQILHQKSGGNPFYMIQFLKKLHQNNDFYFNPKDKEWEWDLGKIQELGIAENVIDLLSKKIQDLPYHTQKILCTAAAIGRRFDLRLLALESSLPPSTALRTLWRAISDEIIQPIGENYQLVESKELDYINLDNRTDTKILFEFTHDRLQQVAYSLISAEDRTRIHYNLGKALQQRPFYDQPEENIFEVTSHLNLAIPLINSDEQRLQLAKMNLIASKKAKNAASYITAYDYAEMAKELLPTDCWQMHYDLTYQIYLELTECSYLTQRFTKVDSLSNIILSNAKTNLEKGNLYIIKIVSYTNIAETKKAIEQGLECLALFGIHFKQNPSKLTILSELLKVKWKLGRKPIASLEYLPKMTDPEKLFAMHVMASLSTPAFIIDKNLLCLTTLKMMCISLDYGVCDLSYFVYIAYATITNLLFRDYTTAYQLGVLAVKTADQSDNNTYRCRANFIMASVVNHWINHLKTSEKYMHSCYTAGLESGEIMYTSFVSVFWGFLEGSFFSNLAQALKNLRRHKNTIFSIKSKQPIHSFVVKENLILALQDPQFRGELIHNEEYNEKEYTDILFYDPELHVAFQAYVAYRMVIDYLFEKYEEALHLYELSIPSHPSVLTLTQEKDINFYHSLSLAKKYPKASWLEKSKIVRQIQKNQKLMKLWMSKCRENSAHRYFLIEAELARLLGHGNKALDHYDLAISEAHLNQYYLEEGIASELAGSYSLSKGKKFIGKAYLEHAQNAFLRADARSKVAFLEAAYPNILRERHNTQKTSILGTGTLLESTFSFTGPSSTSFEGSSLDLKTVLEATTIISRTIKLETLLTELMKIVVKSAGADRAFLIKESHGRWLIEAEKDLNTGSANVLQALPFERESELLSIIIIQYVIRTKQILVLNDAVHMGIFTEDPYIEKHHPKSILCLPVIHQGNLLAILYLENNSSTDAFTPERQDLLNLLSGQIATSLENATLYSNLEIASNNLQLFNTQLEDYNRNLENKVTERTHELQVANEQLSETLYTLKEMQKQVVQQEKLAALGALTHGIAHELKNPLNFIDNFSSISIELMKDLGEQLKQETYCQHTEELDSLLGHLQLNMGKIHDHANRMNGILASMLKHSKESRGEKELVNVNHLLKNCLPLFLKNFQDKYPEIPLEIEKNFDSNVELIQLVGQDLWRALLNILDNATYAACKRWEENPSTPPKIEIRTKRNEKGIFIFIRDNGYGMTKESKERLFHPFFTTKPTGTGTGLGLSISYDIIAQEHSGEIKVETEEGKYTEFQVFLPIH